MLDASILSTLLFLRALSLTISKSMEKRESETWLIWFTTGYLSLSYCSKIWCSYNSERDGCRELLSPILESLNSLSHWFNFNWKVLLIVNICSFSAIILCIFKSYSNWNLLFHHCTQQSYSYYQVLMTDTKISIPWLWQNNLSCLALVGFQDIDDRYPINVRQDFNISNCNLMRFLAYTFGF